MPSYQIRLLGCDERAETFAHLARLHSEEIGGGFLTSLGMPLLQRLYRTINETPHAFILVAGTDTEIVGFLCASLNTKRVYRSVFSRAWIYFLPMIVRRIFSWRTIRSIWETLRYPGREFVPDLPAAEILNFCVSRKCQRGGIGRALFDAMEREYSRRGIDRIRIVTGAAQTSAIAFYEKIGATPVAMIEVHARAESRVFCYSIRYCH